MRLARALIATSLSVALVATLGVAAAAQDVDSKMPAAVLGWMLDETHVADGTSEEVGGVLERRGPQYSDTVVSDDPRLAGQALWTGNGNRFHTEPMFELQRATWEIVSDHGRWVGPGSAIRGVGFGETNTIELVGEGGLAGLSAYLVVEFGSVGGRSRGAIFPGGMPPQP